MLILAHLTGAALGEEMGGPSPYPAAALASVPVQPRFGLLQVGGHQIWAVWVGGHSQSQRLVVLNRPNHFAFDSSA